MTLPGGISRFGSGIISKAMLPLASAGQMRPENMSIQLGNNTPIRGPNPLAALSQMRNLASKSMPNIGPLQNKIAEKKMQNQCLLIQCAKCKNRSLFNSSTANRTPMHVYKVARLAALHLKFGEQAEPRKFINTNTCT